MRCVLEECSEGGVVAAVTGERVIGAARKDEEEDAAEPPPPLVFPGKVRSSWSNY